MKRRNKPRGYVLIFVLLMLLVLGIITAGLYSSSEETVYTAQVMMAQKVAASRADQALQLGIASVKAGGVQLQALVPCDGPATVLRAGSCGPAVMVTSGLVTGPNVGDLMDGAGQQYQWWVWRRALPDGGGLNAQLVNVYAEGYWGLTPDSHNYTVAAVEAEVLIPLPVGDTMTNDWDYGVFR